ncbi:FkbM family methyltransferase [Sphingomonas sp. RT2P30]|uniref:FkbM family methyltransferase n=1 Tax=Parasphingomonas halimpatiens TaxID=3096162 RepID=UPI002FCBF914
MKQRVRQLVTLIHRALRAHRHGVAFVGTSRTRLPESLRFGGQARAMRFPDDPLLVADFANVVLDDDYGLRRITRALRTIVDIGANVGLFTSFARERFPAAEIHAYEPSPGTAAYARHNVAHPLTSVFEEGVAAVEGRAEMIEYGGSNIARTEPKADGAITLTGFATVLARAGGHIDLLKVDCEGAEWDFMRDPALFATVDHIRMEYHLIDGRTVDDVRQLATDLGFRVTRLVANQGFGIVWMDR